MWLAWKIVQFVIWVEYREIMISKNLEVTGNSTKTYISITFAYCSGKDIIAYIHILCIHIRDSNRISLSTVDLINYTYIRRFIEKGQSSICYYFAFSKVFFFVKKVPNVAIDFERCKVWLRRSRIEIILWLKPYTGVITLLKMIIFILW